MINSIVLTVHNKGWLLERVMKAIYDNTVDEFELIVVLDGCTDDSESVAKLNAGDNCRILYADDVFETRANNIGLRSAVGEYVIIIQDDMVINEYAWDTRLRRPFDSFDDVFAVTARTAHNWRINYGSRMIGDNDSGNSGWQDLIDPIDLADKSSIDRNTFAVRNSVNRGPLMIKHSDLKQLGYLDEEFAPLEMDDHDLCYRARKELGKVCGSYWIDYISELEWGGTRNPEIQNIIYNAVRKNAKMLYNRHKDLIENRVLENRYLDEHG